MRIMLNLPDYWLKTREKDHLSAPTVTPPFSVGGITAQTANVMSTTSRQQSSSAPQMRLFMNACMMWVMGMYEDGLMDGLMSGWMIGIPDPAVWFLLSLCFARLKFMRLIVVFDCHLSVRDIYGREGWWEWDGEWCNRIIVGGVTIISLITTYKQAKISFHLTDWPDWWIWWNWIWEEKLTIHNV